MVQLYLLQSTISRHRAMDRHLNRKVVSKAGLEPARAMAPGFEPGVSTGFHHLDVNGCRSFPCVPAPCESADDSPNLCALSGLTALRLALSIVLEHVWTGFDLLDKAAGDSNPTCRTIPLLYEPASPFTVTRSRVPADTPQHRAPCLAGQRARSKKIVEDSVRFELTMKPGLQSGAFGHFANCPNTTWLLNLGSNQGPPD